ncbi:MULTISPECIES: PTS transporter subunit EIIC [unclassified Arthrobacter]|uniref:PTS transporter subunit EIIC n=1 Tax=unclassified Arthrobacter TaxID=235627 RepID=UPI00339515AD
MFWFSPLGGTEMVNGASVSGAQKIFFAQLADPNHVGLFTEGIRHFAGRFLTMMFGLPAACLAMWHCVPKGRRAKYTGLFLSVALTSFITGITEPIEFMFLFVAPGLYVFHAFLDGVSFFLADILNFSFRFGSKRFRIGTPGHLEDTVGADAEPAAADNSAPEPAMVGSSKGGSTIQKEAAQVLDALGGASNLEDLHACITPACASQ